MKSKSKIIGFFICTKEQVCNEYIPKGLNKEIPLIGVEIRTHPIYGAIAKVQDMRVPMNKWCIGMRKVSKNKPVDKKCTDTSKWVKPDNESLQNSLVTECFAVQILKEDSINYSSHYSRMTLLYSILHSHSPTNPQSLTNFAITNEPFETILTELNTKYKSHKFNLLFGKNGKKKINMNKTRKQFKIWKVKMLTKMIKVLDTKSKPKSKQKSKKKAKI